MLYDMKSDYEWFCANEKEIVAGHIGESVIIRGKQVLNYCKDDKEAVSFMRREPAGTYIIQRCLDDSTEHYYTGRFAF